MSDPLRPPAMSVILVTPDRFKRLDRTVAALARQTIANRLELVVVVPSSSEAAVEVKRLSTFAGHRIVETGPTSSSAVRRAEGVRAATAPVVAFTEDHCFPDPGWAEALLAVHEGPWGAVGPTLKNGNPGSVTSWVNLLIEYGPWVAPVPGGPRSHIPPHNSSYKRELLLAYGNRLSEMIEAETVLQWDLRARGYGLWLEPAATTLHFNVSRLGASVSLRLAVGRMFGAARARGWSPYRRFVFIAAAPLIPLVRFARTLPVVRRVNAGRGLSMRVLPGLLAGLVLDGVGELIGYAMGGGDAVSRVTRFEYDRPEYMQPRDLQDFEAA